MIFFKIIFINVVSSISFFFLSLLQCIYMYAFGRYIYPKRLAFNSQYAFYQFMHSFLLFELYP